MLSGNLWFTDNGRDWLSVIALDSRSFGLNECAQDDFPPDELNEATGPDLHFGFPFCYGVRAINYVLVHVSHRSEREYS